jgi:hypothetical protein
MPRRDWNAKLDREYELLHERLARAGAARLGPRRPVRALPGVRPRQPRVSSWRNGVRAGRWLSLRPHDSRDMCTALRTQAICRDRDSPVMTLARSTLSAPS